MTSNLPTTTGTITGTSIALRPAAATRAGSDLVALFRNRLDRSGTYGVPDSIRSDRAPSGRERTLMEERMALLVGSLADRPELGEPREDGVSQPFAEKRATFMALLSAFPTYGLDAKGARATAALYCRAVDDLPTWAVKEAATRFLKGRTIEGWSGERCPTPPKFADEARRSLDEVHAEIAAIRDVLAAEVYEPISDEARRKVLAKIAAAPGSLLAAGRGEGPPRPGLEDLAAAREDALHEMGARFRETAAGGHLAQLHGRLDAKASAQKERVA